MRSIKMFFLTVLMLVPLFVLCQETDTPEEDIGGPSTNDVPIDGGISILIAAGAIYGVKKLNKAKLINKGQPK
jgi:hypothetical protein